MVCPLCNEREGNKKNTHYLTDGIIRPCLNIDGGNDREKGLYFDMSNPGFVEMGFQRGTGVEALRKELGRDPSDEEIEKAKRNPYSVDNVFCRQCEDLFTAIESDFQATELPKLRGANLKGVMNIEMGDTKLSRLFWLIQLWRSAVCVPKLNVSAESIERWRLAILNHSTISLEDLTDFHMSVGFMETSGEAFEMTRNFVGFMKREEILVIFMCEFIIQYFKTGEPVKHDEMYGLNETDFKAFINYKENKFKVKVFNNQKRNDFLTTYKKVQVQLRNEHYTASLAKLWKELFNKAVPPEIVVKYLKEIAGDEKENDDVLHNSKENILKITFAFLEKNKPAGFLMPKP